MDLSQRFLLLALVLFIISISKKAHCQPIIVRGGSPLTRSLTCLTHIVKFGDTINHLAKVYKKRPREIIRANPNINPRSLQLNQPICIPS